MSTGWIYGVLGCHPYELALFHDRAQQEVWGSDDAMLVSSTYQPVGRVNPVDGGFRLSGHWGFSSGSVHCGWVLLGAVIPPSERRRSVRHAHLPAAAQRLHHRQGCLARVRAARHRQS